MIDILIVDDHNIAIQGIKMTLKLHYEFKVVGEALNGEELMGLLKNISPPDVILMDIKMPVMDGIEATKLVKSNYPNIKILGISMSSKPRILSSLLKAGALGYINKSVAVEEMVHAIKMVAAGEPYTYQELALNLIDGVNSKEAVTSTGNISERELNIIKLLAEGLSSQEIADLLFISRRTVESHRKNIIVKTKCKNSAALIKYAIDNSLIP